MRSVGQVAKRAVALMMIVAKRQARIDAGDNDVEQAVVIDVFDHGSAGEPRLAKPLFRRDVNEAARIFGGGEHAWIDPVLLGHAVRIGAKRHVGDVQQPPHIEVVGMLAKVGGQIFGGVLRSGRYLVTTGFANRDDAAR